MRRSWLRRLTVAVLTVLAMVAAGTAPADAQGGAAGVQRVGILRVDFAGSVSDAGRDLFMQRLVEGLAAARFEVFAGNGVSEKLRAKGAELAECKDMSCYPEAASALAVGFLVAARVVEDGKTYTITLDLINGRSGGSIGQNRERCETCGIEEAGEKMGLAASALRARLEAVARTPASFVIRSRPAKAQVTLDGRVVGRTPLDLQVPGGEHRLSLSREGFGAIERRFTAVSGVDETLELDMIAQPTTFPFRTLGWVGLAVGAVSVVGGIYAGFLDGNEIACADKDKGMGGHCPKVRDTKALAIALVGVGVASLSLGGVSVFLASQGGVSGVTETAHVGVRGRF